MSGQSTPAGWYPDPQTPGQQRYWDGAAWSEATQPTYAQPVGYGYAQGAPGAVQPAGFWIRFASALIGGLILGIPFALLGLAVAEDDDGTVFRVGLGYTPGIPAWLNLLQLVVSAAYFGVLVGGPTGQTIGKKLCNIKVVDASTGQAGIGLGRGVGRHFMSIVSSIPCALGYLWMLWDKDKQTWHDKVVQSQVVPT